KAQKPVVLPRRSRTRLIAGGLGVAGEYFAQRGQLFAFAELILLVRATQREIDLADLGRNDQLARMLGLHQQRNGLKVSRLGLGKAGVGVLVLHVLQAADSAVGDFGFRPIFQPDVLSVELRADINIR